MIRGYRPLLGALALAALAAGESGAQYVPYGGGGGGWGFGGFSSTIGGDVARGMGAFTAAEGAYNLETAQANSINANTVMGINQYLYNSSLEAGRRERANYARRRALIDASVKNAEAIEQRVLLNPSEADVDDGAALNAILDQLGHPSILNGSSLRAANARIPTDLIRAIPFRDATDAITVALDQLTDEKAWPHELRHEKFAPERQAYIKAVDDALAEDQNGDISDATIARVRNAVGALYKRVSEVIPPTRQPDHLNAMKYLKGLAGFSKMLEGSNFETVLSELEKLKDTSAGNLIAFMHTYNLRFGAATTPKQQEAYRTLYPILASTRDRLLGPPVAGRFPTPTSPGNVAPEHPTEIFRGMPGPAGQGTTPAPSNTVPGSSPPQAKDAQGNPTNTPR